MSRLLFVAVTLGLGACAGELQTPRTATGVAANAPTATPAVALPGPGGAQSSFVASGEKLYTGTVDATGSDWVYLDLDTQKQVTPADPAKSSDWDIAFKGTAIKLNGGSSGTPPQGRAVKIYGDKSADGTLYPFAQITAAPTETAVKYQTDSLTAAGPLDSPNNPASTGGKPVYAMTSYPEADAAPNQLTGAGDYGWYRSAGLAGMNAVTPRGNVAYVVYSVECRYFRLRLLGYTDASGAAGHPRFEFGEIVGPACASAGVSGLVAPLGRAVFTATSNSRQIAIDATDNNAWVHVDLSAATQTVPGDPGNEPSSWDIAFKRTDIKINSGVSGSGSVAIADGLDDSWEARTTAYTDPARYHRDETDRLAFITYPARVHQSEPQCGNVNGDFGWYYYSGFCDNGGLHHISPRNVVYVVKGKDGNYWKLRMRGYYDAAGSSAHPSLEYAPVTKP